MTTEHLQGEKPLKLSELEKTLAKESSLFVLPPLGHTEYHETDAEALAKTNVMLYYMRKGEMKIESVDLPNETVDCLRQKRMIYRIVGE